jgi:hypothetical protein
MKYSFSIVSTFDPTNVLIVRDHDHEFKGYDTVEQAHIFGEATLKALELIPDEFIVKVYTIPESVEEANIMIGDGDVYPPGHEAWDDYEDGKYWEDDDRWDDSLPSDRVDFDPLEN